MIRTGIFVLVTIFALLLPSFAAAGELTPELSARIRAKAAGDKIPVWIKLPRVEEASQLKASLKAAEPTRQGRHRAAIAQLKRNHAERQTGLVNRLRQMERDGQATGIRARWLANVIEAEVSAGQLEALANRADIELITAVPTLTLISPDSTDLTPASPDAVLDNLKVINADDAWAAGYTGAGRLVCSFDTGVDGDHPAFASRWKGLDGDSAAGWFDPRDREPFPHPTQGASHGTHTMGILTGRSETTDDTVGVAIDAQWMSAAVIDIAGAPIFDAFEWAADPDGDPNSIDDVPDVINHSWGIECAGLPEYLLRHD